MVPEIVRTLLLPPLVALLFCLHLGLAFSLLLLPLPLRPYRWLLMPLAGCTIFILGAAAVTTSTALVPAYAAAGMAVAAVPLNLWALWRTRRMGRSARPASGARESVPCAIGALLALVVFALGILPPLRWGLAAPIGSNWDAAEFYVPLGRALQLASQRDIGSLPLNPLVRILSTPPVSGRIAAFSYLHAAVSSATGVAPLRSYAPLMAFVLGLQPPAIYPFARVLRLPRAAALLGAALVALAWLPLWVAYNNFSNHLIALPLLAAGLASGVVALRDGGRRATATGALFAAGLATAYYPAMTAYVALLGAAAAYLVWRGPLRRAVVGRSLGMAAAALAISTPAQVYFFLRAGFLSEILQHGTGFQVSSFVGLPDALGLAATFNREELPGDARLILPAVALAVLLALAALLGRRVPLLAAMAAGAGAYQAVTAAQAYHYGFYKGVTFEIPIYTMLIAAGTAQLWYLAGRRRVTRRLAGPLLAGGAALLLALNGYTARRIEEKYTAAGPQLWTRAQLDVIEIERMVAPGASALIVPSGDFPPIFNSLIGYALLGHELSGQFSTGYSRFDELDPGRPANVALLPEDTDPGSYGYRASDVTWAGAGLRLYSRNPAVRYHRELGTGGHYPSIAPGASLTLRVDAAHIALPGEQTSVAPAWRRAKVALAAGSFGPTALEVSGADSTLRFALPGGLAELTTDVLAAAGSVTLHNTGDRTAYLWWGELRDPSSPAGVVPRDDVFVQVQTRPPAGTRTSADVELHTQALPGGSQKLTGLLLVSHKPFDSKTPEEVAQHVFFASGGTRLHFDADLEQMSPTLSENARPVELAGWAKPAGDGDYQMTLLLANNARIVYATPLWTWRVQGGKTGDVAADAVPFDIVPLPRPATPLQVDTEDGTLRLRGYTLPRPRARAGESIKLSLGWQSLRKIAADLRARVTLRDGRGAILAEQTSALGVPGHGTGSWQEGEIAEQSFTLRVPAGTPPGAAALVVELVGPDGLARPLGGRASPPKIAQVEIGR